MDEHIIIDGVDVSWCKHYKHNDKNSGWSGCASKDEEHIHSVNPLCCEKKNCLYKQHKRKEQECERLSKGYAELTDIVSPYMDDFTGYNEELGGFDLILCVKELLQQLDQVKKENERLLQTIIKDQAEIVQKNIDETNILLIKENMDLQQQLKAKEQECEELKDKIKFAEGYIETVENVRDELEKKLEKIKEICKNVMPTGIDEETDKFGDILEIIEE